MVEQRPFKALVVGSSPTQPMAPGPRKVPLRTARSRQLRLMAPGAFRRCWTPRGNVPTARRDISETDRNRRIESEDDRIFIGECAPPRLQSWRASQREIAVECAGSAIGHPCMGREEPKQKRSAKRHGSSLMDTSPALRSHASAAAHQTMNGEITVTNRTNLHLLRDFRFYAPNTR